ncbi:MAG: hypothetical protein RMJ19_08555, partial [Gemmatales bacterium]|nr:hypothetical protein [Gemmatales bacterium]MDW8175710.1 hypothetical protein [Gemmatales bacterium]
EHLCLRNGHQHRTQDQGNAASDWTCAHRTTPRVLCVPWTGGSRHNDIRSAQQADFSRDPPT